MHAQRLLSADRRNVSVADPDVDEAVRPNHRWLDVERAVAGSLIDRIHPWRLGHHSNTTRRAIP